MDELREKKGRRGRKERAKRGELDDEVLLVGEIEQILTDWKTEFK